MTRTQLLAVIALAVIIAAVSIPRAIMISRITRAEQRALIVANGFKRYNADTGQECSKIQDLLANPGVIGWLGPYINEKVLQNPWGGTYEVDLKSRKIKIPAGDAAPDKYEYGGSEEISFRFGLWKF